MMKSAIAAMIAVMVMAGCGEDKMREDFPDTFQEDEKESNALIRDQKIRDTMTTHDTTPGTVKPAAR